MRPDVGFLLAKRAQSKTLYTIPQTIFGSLDLWIVNEEDGKDKGVYVLATHPVYHKRRHNRYIDPI
jgi:hypothetical protein